MAQLFNLISSALGLTPETWQDRLAEEITLTSPEGDSYTALWVGNPVTVKKKLGVFGFPGIVGTKLQDLGGEGAQYPLTIYFHGSDNDLDAAAFFESCKQIGPWEIEHPTEGPLTLQWVGYTRHIEPVKRGNVTRFEIESIEPLPDSSEISSTQLSADIDGQSELSNFQAGAQFVLNAVQDTFSQFSALSGAVAKGLTAVQVTLRAAEQFQLVPVEAEAVLRGITSTIESFPIDTEQLTGQVQNLVQLYAEAQDSVSDALDMYDEFIGEVSSTIVPLAADSEGVNTAVVQELFLSAAIVGMAQSTRVGGEKTRSESLENAENISGSFTTITDSLDLVQELYKDSPIELQYFSQSQSYSDALVLAGLAVRYLLVQSFSLAVERRFTLRSDRNFIEIVASELGSLDGLDEFIESNNLSGNDFFYIPAGREVVVYG